MGIGSGVGAAGSESFDATVGRIGLGTGASGSGIRTLSKQSLQVIARYR